MEKFRLLDLPQVVLRRVFQSGLDFVCLALCNSKSHQKVTDVRLKGYQIEVIQRVAGKKINFCLTKTFRTSRWHFQKCNEGQKEECENVRIGGDLFLVKNNRKEENSLTIFTENIQETIEMMKKFIKSLVNSPIAYNLSVNAVENFEDYFMRNVVSEDCKRLEVTGNENGILEFPNPIPSNLMNLVLDKTPSHCELWIMSPTDNDFRYDKKLHFKELYICYASWFTGENMLNTRVESLYVVSQLLVKTADMKQFITRWRNGEYPETHSVYLSFYDSKSRLDQWNTPQTKRMLYQGLQVKVWKCNRWMKLYGKAILPYSTYDMADFQRADGVRASIGIGYREFRFVSEINL